MTQQFEAPSRNRTTFIAVAFLLVALAVGAVTAVNLFPAQASERPVAGAAYSGPLGRLADRASVAGAAYSGPLGRLADRASVAGAAYSGPLGR
jgi:hypothetical protein